ncbi:hypothetical protein TSAR_008018, partial [Trichomalopsis sarcophagae]
KEYVSEIIKVTDKENIRFISRISNSRVCIYLSSKKIANELVEKHRKIKISDTEIKISPLKLPSKLFKTSQKKKIKLLKNNKNTDFSSTLSHLKNNKNQDRYELDFSNFTQLLNAIHMETTNSETLNQLSTDLKTLTVMMRELNRQPQNNGYNVITNNSTTTIV